ncbi:MAG: glycosyltransferase family 2 protein [Bacilli bacterium]|nr:glycosyltransferase family 2 protein [Bacilli bacterium]
MKDVHLIMPMGGAGSRFKRDGVMIPKPLIEIEGKPFFYWAVRSISKFMTNFDLTFVVLAAHIKDFRIDEKIKEYFPDASIIVIPEVLDGAVLTCLEGVKQIGDDAPIIFNDCDHMFRCDKLYEKCQNIPWEEDGLLLSFVSDDAKFSYLQLDENGMVCQTVEKVVVSNHAICGVYCFKNKSVFENAAKKYLVNCDYTEFFVSGVYNVMVEDKQKIGYFDVDMHVSFGTPEEYELAKNKQEFEDLR